MRDCGFSVLELLITIVIIGILTIIAVPYLKTAKKTAQIGATIDTLRNICSAEEAYYAKNQFFYYTTVQKLAEHRFLDGRFSESNIIIDGYKYSSTADGIKFKVTATPIDSTYPEFFVDETFVIKYANNTPIGSNQ